MATAVAEAKTNIVGANQRIVNSRGIGWKPAGRRPALRKHQRERGPQAIEIWAGGLIAGTYLVSEERLGPVDHGLRQSLASGGWTQASTPRDRSPTRPSTRSCVGSLTPISRASRRTHAPDDRAGQRGLAEAPGPRPRARRVPAPGLQRDAVDSRRPCPSATVGQAGGRRGASRAGPCPVSLTWRRRHPDRLVDRCQRSPGSTERPRRAGLPGRGDALVPRLLARGDRSRVEVLRAHGRASLARGTCMAPEGALMGPLRTKAGAARGPGNRKAGRVP